MSLLPNLAAAATVTSLQATGGNANANGAVLDLQPYKGPVTFVLTTAQSTIGVGTLNVASIEDSADNTTFAAVGAAGNFAAVVNTANASNVGSQVKAFDVRDLDRYVRVRTEVSGTNANIPLTVVAIGQLERV